MFKKELRLVLTENCNYNCTFCHKEGMKKQEKNLLDANDYAFLYQICKESFNWDEITLTGGEPFVRKDIDEIIEKLYKSGAKITIVTNGELLNKHVDVLKYVKRINLSIHTLENNKYEKIVQKKGKLEKVFENLASIRNNLPYVELRLNSVVAKGQNDTKEEIIKYINFAKRINASIKFVELYGNDNIKVPLESIIEILKKLGFKYKGICNVLKQELTDGETTVVLSRIFCANAYMQNDPESYCNNYNDLFITPEGNINICRKSKEDISIYNEIKNRDKDGLLKLIKIALENLGKNCALCNEDKKLAINGGNKTLNDNEGKFIHPKITKEIEEAVIEQLHDTISIYDNGNIFGKFEREFAKYHNVKYSLTFSSGTAALWAMYEGIELKNNDEIICPIYTFFATVSPILFTGATPIFCDCDEYGNISPDEVKKHITARTKAIVVTHMWGYPCKMDELRKIADDHNIYLLEDCSHAHGGEFKNIKLGTWSDAAIFSLQGQKIITGGEGGILISNNKNIIDRALLLGHYNKRCKVELDKSSELYKYATTGKGMKLRAHPIAIRIAREYFKHLDEYNYYKNKYYNMFVKELDEIKGISILKQNVNSKNSWYALILKYDKNKMYGVSRNRFVEALQKEGAVEIDIPNSTCPLNNLELFMSPIELFNIKYNSNIYNETFENANNFFKSIIKLPVWYTKEDEQVVLKYIKAIKKVCNNIKELL